MDSRDLTSLIVIGVIGVVILLGLASVALVARSDVSRGNASKRPSRPLEPRPALDSRKDRLICVLSCLIWIGLGLAVSVTYSLSLSLWGFPDSKFPPMFLFGLLVSFVVTMGELYVLWLPIIIFLVICWIILGSSIPKWFWYTKWILFATAIPMCLLVSYSYLQ